MRKQNKIREDMIASYPWNPNRELSFGDEIEAELGVRLQRGELSPVIYNKALDLMRRIEGQLTTVYSGRPHGLKATVSFLVNKCR